MLNYWKKEKKFESQNEEIEVKFVSKRNITQAFNVYKTRDGRITRIEKTAHVHIRVPTAP